MHHLTICDLKNSSSSLYHKSWLVELFCVYNTLFKSLHLPSKSHGEIANFACDVVITLLPE